MVDGWPWSCVLDAGIREAASYCLQKPAQACSGRQFSGSHGWPWLSVCFSKVIQAKKHHLAHSPPSAFRRLLEGEARIDAIRDLHHDQHLLPIRCLTHRAILGRASWAFNDLANPAPAAIRPRGEAKEVSIRQLSIAKLLSPVTRSRIGQDTRL
jgi:hypothetical protein